MMTDEVQTWNGLPPNPAISGPHWLRCKGEPTNNAKPWRWDAGDRMWTYFGIAAPLSPAIISKGADYIAPCVLPAS